MSEEPSNWADQVAAEVAGLDGLAPADTVQVYGRLHTALQSALAATTDTAATAPRPGV